LLHFFVSNDDRKAYAEKLRGALSPGGQAIIATFAPNGPQQCSGLPVRRSDASEIMRVLGPEFILTHSEVREHRTPSGAVQPFTWISAQRSR
jgi:hypothetical protein